MLERALPAPVTAVLDGAAEHHTLTLAAGLAFFGLLSFAPAVGVGLGVLRLLTSDETVQQLVSALQDVFPDTLGFSSLLEQMQGQAARYAGFGAAAPGVAGDDPCERVDEGARCRAGKQFARRDARRCE